MATIIAVSGSGNSGKSTSIILAANIANQSRAILIAKYYYRVNVDIVEVYVFQKENGELKYVAYLSKGDTSEQIKEGFDALEVFMEASKNGNLQVKIELLKGEKQVTHSAVYANMEEVLKGHNGFSIDVVVVACRNPQVLTNNVLPQLSHTWAKSQVINMPKNSIPITANTNWLDAVAKANEDFAKDIDTQV